MYMKLSIPMADQTIFGGHYQKKTIALYFECRQDHPPASGGVILQARNNGYIMSKEIKEIAKKKRKDKCKSGVHPFIRQREQHSHNIEKWQRTALSRRQLETQPLSGAYREAGSQEMFLEFSVSSWKSFPSLEVLRGEPFSPAFSISPCWR